MCRWRLYGDLYAALLFKADVAPNFGVVNVHLIWPRLLPWQMIKSRLKSFARGAEPRAWRSMYS